MKFKRIETGTDYRVVYVPVIPMWFILWIWGLREQFGVGG